MPHLDRLRVLTLNLWAQHGAWADRRSILVDGLRTLRPDLVAFQEAITSDTYGQINDLLGSELHIAHQMRNLLGDGNHIPETGRAYSHILSSIALLCYRAHDRQKRGECKLSRTDQEG